MNTYFSNSFQETQQILGQSELSNKKYILLDLDNTLHDFYHSAGIAKNRAFEDISNAFPHFQKHLADQYYHELILSDAQDGFITNHTSEYFRKRRFSKLLAFFNIKADDFIEGKLLKTYEETLINNLKPYDGLLDFVSNLVKIGKVIYIVTEGPYDAQERVLGQLGILPVIQKMYTSGQMSAPKDNGHLFVKVLSHANISSNQAIVIGDNMERDIIGAQKANINAICLRHK